MTDDNKTFQPEDLSAGAPAPTPDIRIKPPVIAAPATEAPAPAAPEFPPDDIPEIQAPEIVKPPMKTQEAESTQPDSSILDEPQPANSEEGFFKKNKTMIIGGVVILIVITVVVGILFSIKNADKLEGKLKLLESQQSALPPNQLIVINPVNTTPATEPKSMPNVTPLFKAK